MGRLKLYMATLLLTFFCRVVMAQQTIQFSQYTFNGLGLNPAYAGYKDDWTINLSSRIQWTGIADAPKTGTLSFDGLTNDGNKNVGLGLIAAFDQLGPETTSSIYANYAYRLQLDELDTKRLCFGIGIGAIQYRLDGSKLNATDAGDSSIPAGLQSQFTPDFRFGVYYYSQKLYFGASVFNLLSGTNTNIVDNIQIIKQQRTIFLTGGAMLPVSELIDIKPGIILKEDFKGPTNLDLSSYVVFDKRVWLGASYRTGVAIWNKNNFQAGLDKKDAIAAMVQFYANDHFRIGYSYDFTISQLSDYQNGSHEFSVSIGLPGKKQRLVSPRYF